MLIANQDCLGLEGPKLQNSGFSKILLYFKLRTLYEGTRLIPQTPQTIDLTFDKNFAVT